MPTAKLGGAATRLINAAVTNLFARIRAQIMGDKHPTGKQVSFRYRPELTLTGIFDSAAQTEGARPNPDTRSALLDVTSSYLEAAEARAKAHTVQAVHAFLADASNAHVETNLPTVLEGRLTDAFGEVMTDVRRIVETESTVVRNLSIAEAITQSNALSGVEDPTVYFVVVRDIHRCTDCTRLHLLDDEVTPRLWKMSEVKGGYHKKDDGCPSLCGIHPFCRCQVATLLPGYSFDANGFVTFKSPGWDEYQAQRKR